MNKIKQIGSILNANKVVILRRTAVTAAVIVAVTIAGGLIKPAQVGEVATKAAKAVKNAAE